MVGVLSHVENGSETLRALTPSHGVVRSNPRNASLKQLY